MNIERIKIKLCFWWPFICTPTVITLVFALTCFFWPKEEASKVETKHSYGTLEQLTNYPKFREAYIQANGGKQKLAALQSVRAKGTFNSGGQDVPFFTMKRRPNQSLTTLKLPNYELTFGVDGEQVWQRVKVEGQDPVYTLKTGVEADALKQTGIFFDPIMRVVLLHEGELLQLVESEWENQPVVKVDFKIENSGMRASAYIDIQKMHPLARIEEFADGQIRTIRYSDYREVGGMQEPFLVETYIDDILQSRLQIEKSEHNVGSIPTLFEAPADLQKEQKKTQTTLPDKDRPKTVS